jgi:hypothetical protein
MRFVFTLRVNPLGKLRITATFDGKLATLRCHDPQMKEPGANNLEFWLRKRCRTMVRRQRF